MNSFLSLSRRDLQVLCKKNRIPANMTNLAMADALQALKTVEGMGETQEALQFLSPEKADLMSPDLQRTHRRTSSRRVGPTRDEPKERQASPLPRARRVTAKASVALKLVDEVEEGEKKEDLKEVLDTLKAPNTRRRASEKEEYGCKEVSETPSQRTVNTRKRATKKEEKEVEMSDTPATRNGRRASVRRVAEMQKVEVEKEENTMGVMTRRRTRQSSKVTVDTAVENVGRRSTRENAAVKMADLAREEEKEEKDIAGDVSSNEVYGDTMPETKDLVDHKNGSDLISGKKFGEPLMEEAMKPSVTTIDLCCRDVVAETKKEEEEKADDKEEEEKDIAAKVTSEEVSGDILAKTKDPVEEELKSLGTTTDLCSGDVVLETEGSHEILLPIMDCERDRNLDAIQEVISPAAETEDLNIEDEGSDGMSGLEGSPIRGLITSERAPGEEDLHQDSHSFVVITTEGLMVEELGNVEEPREEENGTATDDGEEEERTECVDLDFHLQEPSLSDKISADIEDSDYKSRVNQVTGDSPSPQFNLEIAADATSDQISPAPEILSSDGSDDLIKKEEERSLDLLLTEKNLDSGNDLPVIPHPKPEIAATAIEFHANGEIPTETKEFADADSCGDLTGGILAETKQSSDDDGCNDLPSSIPAETKESADSSDDDGFGDLTVQIPVEIQESGDDLNYNNLTGEIMVETIKSGSSMLIGNSEIIFQATSSPINFPSPDFNAWIFEAAAVSPAKSPAQVGDLIANLPEPDLSSKEPAAPVSDSDNGEGEGLSVGIYRKGSEGKGNDKENTGGSGLTELTTMVVGPSRGEAKEDWSSMSLRKLKFIYKEKVEERRSAVKALEEKCLQLEYDGLKN